MEGKCYNYQVECVKSLRQSCQLGRDCFKPTSFLHQIMSGAAKTKRATKGLHARKFSLSSQVSNARLCLLGVAYETHFLGSKNSKGGYFRPFAPHPGSLSSDWISPALPTSLPEARLPVTEHADEEVTSPEAS